MTLSVFVINKGASWPLALLCASVSEIRLLVAKKSSCGQTSVAEEECRCGWRGLMRTRIRQRNVDDNGMYDFCSWWD